MLYYFFSILFSSMYYYHSTKTINYYKNNEIGSHEKVIWRLWNGCSIFFIPFIHTYIEKIRRYECEGEEERVSFYLARKYDYSTQKYKLDWIYSNKMSKHEQNICKCRYLYTSIFSISISFYFIRSIPNKGCVFQGGWLEDLFS